MRGAGKCEKNIPRELNVASQDVDYAGVIIRTRMVMEKLKSRTALSNFPTTTAAAGIYVLKIELVPA
jgi:hypothetical protein